MNNTINNTIVLDEPNTTSISEVFILNSKKDIGENIDKLKAVTNYITKNKQLLKYWDNNNQVLGKKGDMVTVVVKTNEKLKDADKAQVPNEYFHDIQVMEGIPEDFFTA